MKLYLLLACVVLAFPNALDAMPSPKAAPRLDMKKTVEEIRAYCGITSGQFTYSDKSIYVNYDGMIEPQKLECASQRAIFLGIYFDSYDSTAPYSGPSRFLMKGPPKRLDAAAKDAVSVGWKVTHRADAGDGMAFLEVEVGPNLSRRVVQEFIDKFSHGDFHDIAIGLAPRTMYGHDKPDTEAVFRRAARSMYGALGNKSCNPAPGFNRETVIQAKRLDIATLEKELATSAAAAGQLAIARQDAAYIKPSCWVDDDIRFAKRHLEWDQQAVEYGLKRLRELAPDLRPFSALTSLPNAAEFRNGVRELMTSVNWHCSLTRRGTNEEILAATMTEIGRFESSLRGTDYDAHFRAAKEDTAYDQAGITAECDDPGSEPIAKLSAETLAAAKVRLAALKKMLV